MRIIIEDVITVTMNPKGDIAHLNILIENSRIERISKRRIESKSGDLLIEGNNRIAIPGLINGHIHCDITLARGLGDGLSLYQQDHDSWLSRKGWFSNQLTRDARHLSRLLQYTEAVMGGTTFICDVPFWHYGDDLISPFKEIGLKGAVVLDYRKDFLTGEMIAKDEYFDTAQTLKSNGLVPVVEAPAEEDFSEELLKKLAGWACELDTYIQLHLAETGWRVQITRKRFGKTPVRFLHDLGFLTDRVIGSHGVYIDTEEMTIIKSAGSKIVNCPTAEMKIADGIAPMAQFNERGIRFGIGTDGALWNDTADMFSEMKTLMLLQRVKNGASAFDAESALRAATMGGAESFGLEDEIGSIEEGKRADLVLIDCSKSHLIPFYHGKRSNIMQLITSCARAQDVVTVIVDGQIVVEDGKLKTVDEQALVRRAQELGERMFSDLQ